LRLRGPHWALLAVLQMGAIFLVSSVPDDDSELARTVLFLEPQVQNLLHAPVYGVLAWLWWRALVAWGMGSRGAVLAAAALATVYGALDEVHQYFVPGRFASVTDALLNAAGALAVVCWVFWRRDAAPPTRS